MGNNRIQCDSGVTRHATGQHGSKQNTEGLVHYVISVATLATIRSGAATRRLVGRKVEQGEGWVKAQATNVQDYVKGRGEELCDRAKEVAETIGRA